MYRKGANVNRVFLRKKSVSAVLVSIMVVVTMILMMGMPSYAAVKTSDGHTTDSYLSNLGDESSTRYAGRVWTDKSVYTDDAAFDGDVGTITVHNDSDFLVAYSALATTESITGKSAVPVDVVFVIDNSNSMDSEGLIAGWTGKGALEITIDSVNQQIETILDSNPNSRVSVVVYDEEAHILLPLDHYSKDGDTYIQANYFRLLGIKYFEDLSVSSNVKSSSGSIYSNTVKRGSGGTNIQDGVYTGMSVLNEASSVTTDGTVHMPAMVLLSDGAATYSCGTNSDWWTCTGIYGNGRDSNSAHTMKVAMNAQYMKQQVNMHYGLDKNSEYSCKIYTIGIGFDDLSSNDRQYAQLALNPSAHLNDDNSISNNIMDAWSIYKEGRNATIDGYTFEHPSVDDINTLAYNDGYYSAENAEDVTNVFDDITSDIVSFSAQAPTEIEGGDPTTSGYLTYTDPIGEYMEVKNVKTIIYGGHRFDNPQVSTSGNTTTYTFSGEKIQSPVYGELDVSLIEISVTKDDDGNDTLTVRIPAAAIPLRVNTVELDSNGNVISHTPGESYPARILYTVGTRDDVNLDTLEGVSDDYIKEHITSDGESVNFYSNKYSENLQDGQTVGDAKVTLTPAHTNPFFYMQEDTPLYMSENGIPATSIRNDDTQYFFQITYYEGISKKTTWVSRSGSSFWHDGNTEATIKEMDNGQMAIKQGAPRLGYLTDFAQTKSNNSTNTAEQTFHPVYDGNGQFSVYLGNNGVLQTDAPKSLTINKEVDAGAGLTAPDADFTFELTVASKADSTGNAILTDENNHTTDKELIFDKNGKTTFTLKDGQSMEIINIGEGVEYTVKEINLPDGFTSDVSDNTKTGTVSDIDEDNVVTFTNTYNVEPVTTKDLGIDLGGKKSIIGRDFQSGDNFVFNIAADNATPNAPLPTEDTDKDGSAATVTVEPTTGNEVSFAFGEITFDKPGEYRYIITENTGNLPGIDYDQAIYCLNIIIKDNGDGTLGLASVDGGLTGEGNLNYSSNPFIRVWDGEQSGVVVDEVIFENNYSATDAQAMIQGMKVLTVIDSDKLLTDNEFTFAIEPLGYNTDGGDTFNPVPDGDPEQPMPAETEVKNIANGNVQFASMTFTQEMIGNTYGYKITERLPSGVNEDNPTLNGITYDTAEKIVKVTVTRLSEGETEHVVATVTPNEGIAGSANNFTFTNMYEPSSVSIGSDTDNAITVQKTFTGRDWGASDKFTYTLSAVDGAPMPDNNEVTVEKPVSGNSNRVGFGEITYDEEGIYKYEITEKKGTLGGVKYDTHTAKVTVTVVEDTESGTLNANVTYDNSTAANNSDKVVQDAAAFTNEYTALFVDDTAVNVEGTKTLTGKSLSANMFYFTIDPQNNAPIGDGETLVPNEADGSIHLLDNVTYTKAGDYVYVIKEQIPDPKAKGMDYDESEYRVTVTVTDDLHGNLEVTATKIEKKTTGSADYQLASDIIFENSYDPLAATYTPVKITKVLSGERNTVLKEGEFSFEMSVVNADPEDGIKLPQDIVVENAADGTVQFDNITFTKEGTYVVQVKELIPADADKVPGVIYDEHVIKSTFTVTDNDGQLVVRRTGTDGSQTFDNKYTSTGIVTGNTDLEVTKVFNGREENRWLDSDAFIFTLEAVDETQQSVADGDVILPANAAALVIDGSDTDHKAAFGDITFKAPGDYTFKISEAKGNIPGVDYDTHEVLFTVTAEDNGDGTLDISTDIAKDDLVFTNAYDGEDLVLTGNTAIQVKKELTVPEGSQGKVSLKAGDYSFELTKEALDGSDANGVILPAETIVTNDENGDVTFGDIKFTKAGTYRLTVKEVIPSDELKIPGITYSDNVYALTYKVTEDYENGKLVVENEPVITGEPIFNNVYGAEGTLDGSTVLEVAKTIEGREWNDSDSFTFSLTADKDYGKAVEFMGNTDVAITKDTADHKAAFGDIKFTQTGTYNFTIKENDPKIDNMTYDQHEVNISVNVEDKDGKGVLTVTPTITGKMTFTNIHNPDDATAAIKGTKVFSGRDVKDSDSFTFDIAVDKDSEENTPVPANTSVTVTGKDFTDGKADLDFGTISYDKEGTYIYNIIEQTGDIGGVTYDKGTVTATVEVTYDDADGTFSRNVTYSKEGGAISASTFEFTNVYKALPTDAVEGVFEAAKTVTPSEGNTYDMKGGEFEFTIAPSADNPTNDPIKVTTVKNDAKGAVTFAKGAIYTEPGEYVYTIQEVPNGVGGIIYDDAVYTVTVTVNDDGSGKLKSETSIIKDGAKVESVIFDNFYDPDETGIFIGGSKELTGKNLEADMFSFKLTGIDGAPMPADGQTTVTVKNNAGGVFNFGDITYDKVGEYEYQVSEINDGRTGVIYDTVKYNVKVTVTDEDGELKAVPSVENSRIVFKNSYVPIPLVMEGNSAIGGSKELTGRDLKDGEFVFQLKDGDKIIAEAKNDEKGTFAFAGIKIEKAGTYNYTLSEKMNGVGGIEYDKTVYNVCIDARDENGYIKADVTYSVNGKEYNNAVFTNAYSYRSTSVQIGAIKKLQGRDLVEGEFTFRLEDTEGNLISEAVNDKNGSVIFDKIDYEKPGTFNYVVYEVEGNAKGITYDENVYDVTVNVTDSEKGYLTADITGDEGLTFVNVYEKPETPIKTDDGTSPAKTSDNAAPGMLLLIMMASGAAAAALRKKSR